MRAKPSLTFLPDLIARIEAALAAYPASLHIELTPGGFREKNPRWAEAERKLRVLILDEGGRSKEDWSGAMVQLWGLKATSTTGLRQATHNWLAQARAKLAHVDLGAGSVT